jgi:signal transduction histidine kinase
VIGDFLALHPEIVGDVEAQVDAFEPVALRRGRRERLRSLLSELGEALAHGGVAPRTRVPFEVDGDGELLKERDLLRTDILERLKREQVDAPTDELKVLSDWVWATDHVRLTELNARKSALLDLCPDVVTIVSLDGRILYANRATEQMFQQTTGLSPEEILGRTGIDLGFCVEAGPAPSEFHEIARSRAVAEVLVMGRWHELRAREIVANDGTVQALGITLTDIHDRKLALVRLEMFSKLSRLVGITERDELWKALAQVPIPQMADWCAVTTIERREIRSTFMAQRDPSKAGLRDALVGAISALKAHPLWQEMLTTGFQLLSEVSDDLLKTLSTSDEYYRLVSQVGIRSLVVVPVIARGQPLAIITLAYTRESGRRYGRDDPALALELALHAAHAAENTRLIAETRISEARFRVALADAHTIVYEQDDTLRYVWDYSPDLSLAMVGKAETDVLPPDEAAMVSRIKQQVLDTGQPASTQLELSFTGERRWYREAIEAVQDRLGRRTGVIGAATDVTEEKRVQEELKSAVDLRERVMGILGHDLRNPLAAMTLAASTLLRRGDLPDDATRTIARIDRGARRMTEMIETLLDFTRVRVSGKALPIVRTRSDLAEVAKEIVEELRAAWPDRSISLETEGCTQGLVDAQRIAQALSNLIGNAIMYGGSSEPIRVSIEGDETALRARVHNLGRPIPEALLADLFEPFKRGHPDVISPHGLGLGLFVVKEIVTAHGGSVAVESTLEKGTTFSLHLPRTIGEL